MKGKVLYQAMLELDDALIEKYAEVRSKQTMPLRRLVAACLLGAFLIGGSAVAVDAITYAQAKDFFDENGLSIQGLSRTDVRAVYRDITTKSFTYEKTDEVIAQGIREAIPGYEITANMDDPADVRKLWESWENGELEKIVYDGEIYESDGDIYQKGTWYKNEGISVFNTEEARSEIRKSVVRKYQDDTLCWESTVPFVARLMKPIGEGTVVIGEKEQFIELFPESDGLPKGDMREQIAYLDENGQLLWCKVLTEEYNIGFDEKDCAYDNGDGTFTIFTRSVGQQNGETVRTVWVWQYDLSGEQLSCKMIDIDQYFFSGVYQVEDHYVLSLSQNGFACKLVVIDADGVVLADAQYQITDQLQHITDIAEVGNYLYISMYTMLADGGLDETGRANVALTQEKMTLWEQQDMLSEKEMIKRIRSHYSAVLLRCDIETGQTQSFYTVPGVIADKLELGENGELIWHLQSLTRAELLKEQTRNVCHIRGTSVIYRYVLDAEGNLKGKEKTDEISTYQW